MSPGRLSIRYARHTQMVRLGFESPSFEVLGYQI